MSNIRAKNNIVEGHMMKELKMNLENCYGIRKMQQDIDFTKNNVGIIYASNGTMKSSLAKTFDAIRDGRVVEEKIFGTISSYNITDENGVVILPESIVVINPFDEKTYDNQGMLMANADLRREYLLIHKNIDAQKEFLYAELKSLLGYSPRSSFDVESTMLSDWNYTKKELFTCLEGIASMLNAPNMNCGLTNDEIDYNTLFNDKVYSMITTGETSELIEEYEKKYSELIEKSLYMQKGIIDHNNYANISTSLNNNGFFGANNEIKLNAKDGSSSIMIKSQIELNNLITKEKEQILNTKELKDLFEKINKVICKNKDTQAFNTFLQKHPDIVAEYKDIEKFKKKVWVKAFLVLEAKLIELLDDYKKAQGNLDVLRKKAKEETTDWNKALELFKERFYVPFSIETANQEDVILNMDMPSFKYIFSDERGAKEVAKENLLDVLSTGEKRAYYILNMIFQILVAKNEGQEKIVILDDISESFDYKNKHAIIEYISDIAEFVDAQGEKLFKVLLLTHNFDFYRTVASRITSRANAYIAFSDNDEIKFEKGKYTKNIFGHYKDLLNKGNCDNIIVAAIPFVRNLIEYTEDDSNADYLCLTSILHYKADTKAITLKEIQDIFNRHWCKSKYVSFAVGRESEQIYNIIITEANKIGDIEKLEIESKLILSMAIRLKSDEFMIQQISTKVANGSDIINDIYSKKNQSAWLIKEYKKSINDDVMGILEQVAMLTSENIHLNSFMFEPILDMSLVHLYDLYQKVKVLMP